MAPLLNASAPKRTNVVAVDLGQRTTKAVHLQRNGDTVELLDYALLDSPFFEKTPTPDLLAAHFKALGETIGLRGRRISIVLGVNDAVLRTAEMPAVPVHDMRLMLKYNSKNYLQQDMSEYVFDCFTLGMVQTAPPIAGESAVRGTAKARVLVGAAKQQTLDQLQAGAKAAGLNIEHIVPSMVCPGNAFEAAMPEHFANDVIALVDIGFKSSTINILTKGEIALNRVVSLGGDKLTSGLADAMGVSYAEAEGIKIGLPEEVQGAMQGLITPLGRELRASIDFFEHQQDKSVAHVYVSGGSSRSQFVVESLQSELMVQTKSWNPVAFMKTSLSPEKLAELEQVASQLVVAVGGGLGAI